MGVKWWTGKGKLCLQVGGLSKTLNGNGRCPKKKDSPVGTRRPQRPGVIQHLGLPITGFSLSWETVGNTRTNEKEIKSSP